MTTLIWASIMRRPSKYSQDALKINENVDDSVGDETIDRDGNEDRVLEVTSEVSGDECTPVKLTASYRTPLLIGHHNVSL